MSVSKKNKKLEVPICLITQTKPEALLLFRGGRGEETISIFCQPTPKRRGDDRGEHRQSLTRLPGGEQEIMATIYSEERKKVVIGGGKKKGLISLKGEEGSGGRKNQGRDPTFGQGKTGSL